MDNYKPGDNVTLTVDGSNYSLALGEHPQIEGFPYIGIGSRVNVSNMGLFFVAFPLLGLIASLSILVGAFNILPIYPLDGGLVVKSLAEKVSKKHSNRITMIITYILLIVIIYSFVSGFF